MKSDKRFTLTREATGDITHPWVVRFCGDWVMCYRTRWLGRNGKAEAIAAHKAKIEDVCADIAVGGIAGIIRAAASQRLWDGTGSEPAHGRNYTSCVAVADGHRGDNPIGTWEQCKRAEDFLHELGAPSGASFKEFKSNAAKQGARFLWLQFAALVAQDEGL